MINDIHCTSIVQKSTRIQKNVFIGAYCIIGDSIDDKITISVGTKVGHHSHIFGKVFIGQYCTMDAFTRIGPQVRIGKFTRLLYGARVHNNVKIGNHCVIAGNCPDNTKLGNNVIHLGKISHSFYYPFSDWDGPEEPGPNIGSNVVIGTDANIIGPISIGNNSFIFPREIIRKDLPPNSIYRDGKSIFMPNWAKYLKSLGAANWINKERNEN